MDIAKGPLYGSGAWAIRRSPQQRKAGMGCSPRPDRFGFMYFVVIDHDRDTPHPALRVGTIQEGQQVTKEGMGFPRAEAMEELPGSEIEGASQGVFFVLPWRHDFLLAALGYPCGPNLGQQVDIECIRKDHHLMCLPRLRMQANPGQALGPFRIVIFGDQLGAFPHPTQLMEPAAHGPCGHLQPVFRPQLRRQRGTTPSRPAPAIGPWRDLEQRLQRTLQPRQQESCPNGCRQRAVCGDRDAQLPNAIETHNAVHTGARTEQAGRNRRRIVASRTQQEHVQCQEVALARAAQCSEHLLLLFLGDIQ